ncbi:DUF349 domain-containing protein [candidate division KSB1 bacterium]
MEDNKQKPVKGKEKATKKEDQKKVANKDKNSKPSAKPAKKKPKSEAELSDTTAKLWEKIQSLHDLSMKSSDQEDVIDMPIPPKSDEDKKVAKGNKKKIEATDSIKEPSDVDEEGDHELEEETHESYDEFSREKLVEKLEEVVQDKNVNLIKSKVALIKVAFLKNTKEEKEKAKKEFIMQGGAAEDYVYNPDVYDNKFHDAFEIYRTKKTKWTEEQDTLKQKNLEEKQKILEELKDLINSEETLKRTYDDFKSLQERWKEIGQVPKSEINTLWQSYHFLVEKFFDKVKINKELKDLDLRKNLEAKIKLCEKAEELLLESSIIKSFKQLQKYHNEWKELGPVPQDKKDEIWERFKNATDKINQRRREHYEQLQEDLEKNFDSKKALCDKAESIVAKEIDNIRDWQKATDQINELLNIWKSIGRAPKDKNNEIWDRFKTYLDTFFAAKKEYYSALKEQQVENYNLKLDLCQQAEALKTRTNWKLTTEEMIKLQKEWKSIGPVPRKHSDKIWKRFRSSCDEFFKAKAEYYSNIHEHEATNLNSKKELIKKVAEYKFTDDKPKNLEILKEFQREWMEIGHVPIKEKDKLQNQFREVINNRLDALKISSVEINTLSYKTRIENIKESPGANRAITKERNIIYTRINKLRDDIHLWENNIGFLAESKKANILKDEFEKKIKQAKDDLLIMEAKLKYLDEVRSTDY